jgi:hypothetical protein
MRKRPAVRMPEGPGPISYEDEDEYEELITPDALKAQRLRLKESAHFGEDDYFIDLQAEYDWIVQERARRGQKPSRRERQLVRLLGRR